MNPKPRYEELDYRQTQLGELILRRRTILALEGREVLEMILNGEHLMSSLFTAVEIALARLGLAAAEEVFPDQPLDVVVGGLGLGYTAQAALEHRSVGTLRVVDFLEPVIEWHRQERVPLGAELNADPRCEFVHGDFFKLALAKPGEPSFNASDSEQKFHAVLLDIDHTPSHHLNESNAPLYTPEGLCRLADKIHPGGVFAMWSDDPPTDAFMNLLREVFASAESHIVTFDNPLRGDTSASTVYVAKRPA